MSRQCPAFQTTMKRKTKPDLEISDESDSDGDTVDATAEDIATQAALDKDTTAALAIEEIVFSEDLAQGRCRVTRRGQLDAEYLMVESVPVSSMKPDLFEFLSQRYGGGRYEMWFFLPTGKYYARKKVDIDYRVPEGEFFRLQRQQAAAQSGAGPTAVDKLVDKLAGGGDGQNVMLTFLKMSQEQNAAMLQSNMQMVTAMMGAMANMVGALKGGEQKPAFNMLEAMAVFDKLKTKDNPVDPLRLFEVMHKWFRDNQSNGEEAEPWWIKPIQALAPMLLGKMPQPQNAQAVEEQRQIAEQPQPSPQPEQQQPGKIEPNNTPIPHPPTELPPDPMNIIFLSRMIRPKLFAQIASGALPQDAVDLVNNPLILTDDQYDKLEAVLKTDTWEKELFGDINLTAEQQLWLNQFRSILLSQREAV